MIGALASLLLCQLAGELVVRLVGLPVPGPVLGMLLLFLVLLWRKHAPPDLESTAQGLLQHLSLLFVPAGVGVIAHLARLRGEWLAIIVALVVSTWATLIVTALVFRWASRWAGDKTDGAEPAA